MAIPIFYVGYVKHENAGFGAKKNVQNSIRAFAAEFVGVAKRNGLFVYYKKTVYAGTFNF